MQHAGELLDRVGLLQQLETVVKSMDPLNLQVLVNASGASGDRLVQSVAAIKAAFDKAKDR